MPSHVTVLYFAHARDASGVDREVVAIPSMTTVGSLKGRILASHPRLGPLLGSCRIAVDRELALDSTPISGGEEVAVLPPVAGG